MGVGDVVDNLTLVLPSEIANRIDGLVIVLKALGVFAIIYVIYLIIMAVVNFHRVKKLKVIEGKVDSIEKKLDKLLKSKKR